MWYRAALLCWPRCLKFEFFHSYKNYGMKKLTLLLSALMMFGASYAHEGHGKKNHDSKSKKESCENGKDCCKKGEKKTAKK